MVLELIKASIEWVDKWVCVCACGESKWEIVWIILQREKYTKGRTLPPHTHRHMLMDFGIFIRLDKMICHHLLSFQLWAKIQPKRLPFYLNALPLLLFRRLYFSFPFCHLQNEIQFNRWELDFSHKNQIDCYKQCQINFEIQCVIVV